MTLFSKKRFQNEKGFSIAELLIAVMILVILLMGIFFMFEFGLTNANTLRIRTTLNIQASNILEKMIRQIRCANQFKVPVIAEGMADNPTYFVADTQGIVNSEGNDINREVMFYRTTADNILYIRDKAVGESTWTDTKLADYTTVLIFTYYDTSGNSLGNAITEANRKSIKKVNITLTMRRTFTSDTSSIEVTKTGSVVVRSRLTKLWGREING